ncbi:hypothetical protein B8V81_0319 [Paenibacillus pasadenensis]|uniref:Uncharacterized protein n=1 Tax=Paenibacillus pasadenensis TaxID=217090 RepID=A0A2N5NCW4_9BACL|nr:hypothetical protein B8V81_0319 [Paenibacillus pasadenensis]
MPWRLGRPAGQALRGNGGLRRDPALGGMPLAPASLDYVPAHLL